jgi:hypothetical protein
MKVTYHEWKCVGCPTVVRFTGKNIFSLRPDWFALSTEASSNEIPRLNTSVCSIDCLEKAGFIIRDFSQNRRHAISRKKHIEATICDRCGKVVKVDRLNMICGPSPLEHWTWEESPEGRKDFCSTECKKNHFTHPENSVFVNFKFDEPMAMKHLIDAIDASDFVEQIKKGPKPLFQFPSSLRKDIERINKEGCE